MDVYSISILASILIYIAVGNYAGRKVKHLEDYFVAGRQAPTLLIVGTLVASFLSTNTFLAETGKAYSHYAGPWILLLPLHAMGYIYGSLFFGRYLRRRPGLTSRRSAQATSRQNDWISWICSSARKARWGWSARSRYVWSAYRRRSWEVGYS